MAATEKDKLSSALNIDILSAAVFNFFCSATSRNREYYYEQKSTKWIEHTIPTGSVPEFLEMPEVTNKTTGKVHTADHDYMDLFQMEFKITGEKILIFTGKDTMVIQDRDHPVHCYVKVLPESRLNHVLKKHQGFRESIIVNNFLSGKAVSYINKARFKINNPEAENIFFKGVCIQSIHRNSYYSYDFDMVLCLQVKCPETVLQKLSIRGKAARNSCLPKLERVVKDLHDENIHVVYKPHVHSSNPDIQWRFSFSLMERKLARSLNDTQRTATRVLKALVFKMNEDIVDKDHKLPSYFLKTALFWICEELPKGFCFPRNIGKLFLVLIDKIICLIKKSFFPHYFIPEGNLLDPYPPCALRKWALILSEIRSRPLEAMVQFWNVYALNAAYEYRFIESVKQQDTVSLISFAAGYHLLASNVVGFMRLLAFNEPVFCLCKGRQIIDFFEGCQKCLIIKFCKVMDKSTFKRYPHVLPIGANMWFVRSLEDNNKNLWEQKAILMFKQARVHKLPEHERILQTVQLVEYHIHYALYLRAKKKYEDAVQCIVELLELQLPEISVTPVYVPCFLIDILTEILQIRLSGKPEIPLDALDLAYHILCSCYCQSGVFTELIMPDFVLYKPGKDSPIHPTFGCDARDVALLFAAAQYVGDQFYLCKDYYKAAEWYITQYMYANKLNIINLEFLVCVAKLFNKKQFQNSVKKYLNTCKA